MKVCINKNDCIGCGLCADIAPEVFEVDGGTAAYIVEITDKNKISVTDAADGCPVGAISIEE